MNLYKESELLAIKITSSDISETVLSTISDTLHAFRDQAERQMDKAIIDYEALDQAADVVDMEIERRETNINGILQLCLTGE